MICSHCKNEFKPTVQANTNVVICPHCYFENNYIKTENDAVTKPDASKKIASPSDLLSEKESAKELNIKENKYEKIKCDKCKTINDSRRKSKFCISCGWPLKEKYVPPKTNEEKLKELKEKKKKEKKFNADKKVNTMKFNTLYAVMLIIGTVFNIGGNLLLYVTTKNITLSIVGFGIFSLITGILLFARNKIGYILAIIKSIFSILLCGFVVVCSALMVYNVKSTQIEKIKFLYNQRAIILSCEDEFDIDKEINNIFNKKSKILIDNIKHKNIDAILKEFNVDQSKISFNDIKDSFKSLSKSKDISDTIKECETPKQLISLGRTLSIQYYNSIMKSTTALIIGIPSVILFVVHILIVIYYKRRLTHS